MHWNKYLRGGPLRSFVLQYTEPVGEQFIYRYGSAHSDRANIVNSWFEKVESDRMDGQLRKNCQQ